MFSDVRKKVFKYLVAFKYTEKEQIKTKKQEVKAKKEEVKAELQAKKEELQPPKEPIQVLQSIVLEEALQTNIKQLKL